MADRVRGVTAVGQDVVESFETGDSLILAEGDEKVGEFVFWDGKLFDGLGQGHENRVSRIALIAGVEFGQPLIKQCQGGSGVTDFVAQIVGDAAVSVNVQKILAQVFGQEPGGDRKVFVMRTGELAAELMGLFE